MKRCMFVFSFVLVLVLTASGSGFAKPFYEGKTIQTVVATKPGGNYDFYARLVAHGMQKYLPGSTVIVKNVPGAGHIIGTNEIYASKPNGLKFGTFNRALALSQLANLKGVKFDLTKMSWLGSAASDTYCLLTVPKFKTLDDVMNADLVRLASAGLGSQSHITAALFAEMKGLNNLKNVTGYGGGEAELAMMRGEVDGQFASWSSMAPFVATGQGQPVLFIGKKQPQGFENVPLLQDVVKDKKYQSLIDLLLALNVLARPYAGPPAIPVDRLKILKEAFAKTCADPETIQLAKKGGVDIDFTDGDDALKLIKGMLNQEPSVIKLIKEAYGASGS